MKWLSISGALIITAICSAFWAGIQATGHDKEALKIILVQFVNLRRGGAPVAMSTRSGEFVTLREVLDEVGKDAARYNFLMRRSDSHLDFDLEVVSISNPMKTLFTMSNTLMRGFAV